MSDVAGPRGPAIGRRRRRRGRIRSWALALRSTFDDATIRVQHGLDQVIRWLRLGAASVPGRRRLLIVQIDGLARAVLDEALARGYMPHLRGLLSDGRYRMVPMTAGIPTSTPAFQMAIMYGVQPDIPGFHYYDKRRHTDIHFPRPGHAAFVESSQTGGHRGILEGGSVYGCVFTGGAAHDFFSFARLTRPRVSGLVRAASALAVLTWVAIKGTVITCREVLRTLGRLVRRPIRWRAEWSWFARKTALSVWTREWFTFAVARDVYDGVPAIYVNFIDYDEFAHAFGPRSRRALAALRGLDRSIRRIQRVLRRVAGYRYDLYVLADHGQASCTPYRTMGARRRFEDAFFDHVPDEITLAEPESRPSSGPPDPAELGFEPYLDVHESCERHAIRVVSAGPNAFVYFVDTPEPLLLETIEARCPGLVVSLSKSPGVGFVLARSATGPVCLWRGESCSLEDADRGPFAGRDDRTIVTRDLATLMAMPSAGDLVVYGTDAPEGHVSYLEEVGAHAGPSPEELHTFVVAPVHVSLPARIDHPIELHRTLIRYQPSSETPVT
jgi:hypothetical protein